MEKFLGIMKIALRNNLKHPIKNILIGIMVFLATFILLFTASLNERCIKEWRNFFSTTDIGYINVSSYLGQKKDYTAPAYEFPKSYISDNIIKYLDDNKIDYSKRLKLGGIKYNFETQEFDGGHFPSTLLGADFEKDLKFLPNLEIIEGKYDKSVDNGALVWKALMKKYNWKVGDEISFFITDVDNNNIPVSFTITGAIYNKTGDNMESVGELTVTPLVWCSYEYLSRVSGAEEGKAMEVAIWNKESHHIEAIKNMAASEGFEFFYAEQGYNTVKSTADFLNFMGMFMGVFILIILVIATFNINIMSFLERQKEVGTMLAMGAKPGWIIKLLVTEMFQFGIAAFVISLSLYSAVKMATVNGVNFGPINVAFAGNNFHFELLWQSVAATFITIIATVFVTTLYPIYLTTRLNPVEIFREGEV